MWAEELHRADAPGPAQRARHPQRRAGDHAHTAPRSRRPACCPACCAATTSGARASPSPTPGPTSPASRPARCSTATTGWSTARRCGPASGSTRSGASCSCAPTPTRRSTAASPASSSTCRRPGYGPSAHHDHRVARLQRGVLRRRPGARDVDARPGQRGLARRDDHAHARTRRRREAAPRPAEQGRAASSRPPATTPGRNGGTVAQDPALRQRLAQVYLEAELLKLIADRAISGELHGRGLGPESSIAKLQWSETDQHIAEVAAAVLGPDASTGRVGHRSPVVPSGDDRRWHHADQQEHHRPAHPRTASDLMDRGLSVAQYLVGVMLAGVTSARWRSARYAARARWLPTWHGAPARLAEISGGLIVLITVPATARRRRSLPPVAGRGDVVCGRCDRRPRRRPTDAHHCHAASEPVGSIAGLAPLDQDRLARRGRIGGARFRAVDRARRRRRTRTASATATRSGTTFRSRRSFVQSGSTTEPLFTDANPLVTYFPANVGDRQRRHHAASSGRDVLIPLANLGWLGARAARRLVHRSPVSAPRPWDSPRSPW